jgi:NAD(P)H-hydrate epimerase
MKKYSPNKKCVVMSRDEVRAFDQWAIDTLGLPGVVLMENAGRSCAELIKDKLKHISRPKVCIFCGTGNNGGDGSVIARHLINSGFKVIVVLCGDRGKVKGDAKINLDVLERLGQSPRLGSILLTTGRSGQAIERLDLTDTNSLSQICHPDPERAVGESNGEGSGQHKQEIPRCARNDILSNIAGRIKDFTAGADMLVDALFGTGLSGQLSDEYKTLIESINAQNHTILAVDIPSGLDCDTGQPLGAAIKASYTVTFVAVKKGFTASTAAQWTGEVFVASIGVQPQRR